MLSGKIGRVGRDGINMKVYLTQEQQQFRFSSRRLKGSPVPPPFIGEGDDVIK